MGIASLKLAFPGERVTLFYGDALGKYSGAPLAFPPLHMHHVHLEHDGISHWFETHGDYGFGNVTLSDGYKRTLPDGYCYVMPSVASDRPAPSSIAEFHRQCAGHNPRYKEQCDAANMAFEAEINDVRFIGDALAMSTGKRTQVGKPPTGPSVDFYFRVALGVTTQPCKPASKIIVFAPGVEDDTWDRYRARRESVM